jgi:small subunit ribosomal protein S6
MIYILRPSVHPDEADRIAARFSEIVTNLKGKLVNLSNWGRRRLAYPIKKESRGVFVYARFLGYEDLVAELERNLRLIDAVLRYQTILLKAQVDMDEISVDPADIEFQRLEIADEEDEPQLAQRLGLVEKPKAQEAELKSDQDSLEDEYMEEAEEFNNFDHSDGYTTDESEPSAIATESQQSNKNTGEAKPSEIKPSADGDTQGRANTDETEPNEA